MIDFATCNDKIKINFIIDFSKKKSNVIINSGFFRQWLLLKSFFIITKISKH